MISLYWILFLIVVFTSCVDPSQSKELFASFNSSQKNSDCECGEQNDFTTRIVGGKTTQPNQYPWMVAIFYFGLMFCGGSIINDRYIITAGHCLKWVHKDKLEVVLAMHDRVLMETQQKGGQSVEIEEIILHENFTTLEFYDINDIALIKLKNPLQFSTKISPICLPTSKDEDYSDSVARITGWGRTGVQSKPSRYLKEAQVFIIPNKVCKKAPGIGKSIINTMMCAYQKKTDACQGDSGGPLFYETKTGRIKQIGVVSWGIGCATPKMPGVYTKITSYLDWIASHTEDAMYCKIPL